MRNLYESADKQIASRMGESLKALRLKQNITQQSIAEASQISLSTVKKIESGEIGSFDAFLRMLRTLGKLEILQPLVEQEEMSPNEYYEFVNSKKRKVRKRAVGTIQPKKQEDSEW